MDVREEHWPNTLLPMLVTEAGIVNEVRDVQL